jgi:pimeloyl-ACP methyl ester carboxylesterase
MRTRPSLRRRNPPGSNSNRYPSRVFVRLYGWLCALLLLLSGVRRRRFLTERASLAYFHRRRSSPEEPWIFLHGLAGSAATTWWPEFFALRGGGDLVAIDLGELGGTEAPGGALSVSRGAEVVAELLEREWGGRPATIVGLSLGGWMAVRIALAHPGLVGRLILVDAAGYREQDWDRISSVITLTKPADADRLAQALFAHPPWYIRSSQRALYNAFTAPGVRTILRETVELDTYNRRDLHRLKMPVELVWGERDGLFELESAQRMRLALPNGRLHILPGCGHAVHLECPTALAGVLRKIRKDAREPLPSSSPSEGPKSVHPQPDVMEAPHGRS